ncbi:hypothetical protein CEXT_607601 [Caerostris extrusa]|uniref:Uncharacterized protein n=1 Tax=Caerostris extrusa TaxID=172846 RepID=A0AAV4Y7Z2_CAEEX|nr:hypothetical protein CEXT_607601 [Caerostris extrusa]
MAWSTDTNNNDRDQGRGILVREPSTDRSSDTESCDDSDHSDPPEGGSDRVRLLRKMNSEGMSPQELPPLKDRARYKYFFIHHIIPLCQKHKCSNLHFFGLSASWILTWQSKFVRNFKRRFTFHAHSKPCPCHARYWNVQLHMKVQIYTFWVYQLVGSITLKSKFLRNVNGNPFLKSLILVMAVT